MTYFIAAVTNDKARLVVSETQTTDIEIAKIVEKELVLRGFQIVAWQRG